jgi:pimeloyl-ACP methyl ester carboxylesterase
MSSVSNQGVNIYYELEGSGPPLVLVHQLAQSLQAWRSAGYTRELAKDHLLVLIDPRGHGQSDKPHDKDDYSPGRMASDVLVVVDHLGIRKFHYLGYSLGGMMGCVLLQTVPDRLCSLMVGGIDFFARPTEAERQTAALGRAMLLKATAAGGGSAAVKIMDANGTPMSPGLRYMLMNNDTEALVAAIDGMLTWPGVGELLPKITIPCLVWAGSADVMHDRVRDAAAQIPGATFISLPGLDHDQAAARGDLILPHITEFLSNLRQ